MGEVEDNTRRLAEHMSEAITPALLEALKGFDYGDMDKPDRVAVTTTALVQLGATFMANAAVQIVMNAKIDQVEAAIEGGLPRLTALAKKKSEQFILRGFIKAAEMRGVLEDARNEAESLGLSGEERQEHVRKRVEGEGSGVHAGFDVVRDDSKEAANG